MLWCWWRWGRIRGWWWRGRRLTWKRSRSWRWCWWQQGRTGQRHPLRRLRISTKKWSVCNSFFYLNNFLPLNNMWLVMLHMRDSEVCDPCLHFLFLFLLCFLRLMLGVAHGLVNMLVQELKELVDIPAISISRACWYPCNGGISQLHSPPRQTFSSHELAWIANWGKLKQHSLKACRCWKRKKYIKSNL